jgi:tight adherence protein C
MFSQVFDVTRILPFAVFRAFSAIAWLVIDRLLGHARRAEDRLERFGRDKASTETGSAMPGKSSAVMAMLVDKASPQLAKPLQPTSQKDASRLKMRLTHGGFRAENAATVFLALKAVCLICGFFLGGGAVFFTLGFTKIAVMRAVIATGLALFLPDVVLWLLTRRRQQAIFLGLPDALDLMVVCVEAGLGLDQAMRTVSSEMRKAFPIIAHEFDLANMQLQMGWTRVQVLRDLGNRNGEDDLRALASVLIHAAKFGTGVGAALRVQSDAMRVKRRQIAEEKAAKSAVKLIFPLVLFIFPGIFVVLVGPAAVSIARNLLPAMGG